MTRVINVERNKIGVQDVLFGVGSEVQSRDGVDVTITSINAQNMPFDESRTLAKALADEHARAFVQLHINDEGDLIATYAEIGLFHIDDDGYLILEYEDT